MIEIKSYFIAWHPATRKQALRLAKYMYRRGYDFKGNIRGVEFTEAELKE